MLSVCVCVSHGDALHPVYHIHACVFFLFQSTSSALSYLEKRQEWVLSHITQLQERVRGFANELGVGAADVGILQQVNTTVYYTTLCLRGGAHFDHAHLFYIPKVHLLLAPECACSLIFLLLGTVVYFVRLLNNASTSSTKWNKYCK